MGQKLKIRCALCGEIHEYEDISRDYRGNIKCETCKELFWIRVNDYVVDEVRDKPPK